MMRLRFDTSVRDFYDESGCYRDHPRKGRVYYSSLYREMATKWVIREMPCPHCGFKGLDEKRRNPAKADDDPILMRQDFANVICRDCSSELLLIATRIPVRGVVQCPYYKPVVKRMEQGSPVDIICLRYDRDNLVVRDCFVIRGGMLSVDYMMAGGSRNEAPEEPGKDIWCDIEVGRLVHDTNGTAIIDVVNNGKVVDPYPSF